MFSQNTLKTLFIGWILLCSSQLSWGAGSLDSVLGQRATFLPVEEAYRVDIKVNDEAVVLDWAIQPGYYLYKDKFKVEGLTQSDPLHLQAVMESGLFQYDEYEQAEVEIFYNSTRITVPAQELPQQFILKLTSQGCADAGLCYAPVTQFFDINRQFNTAVETDASALAAGGAAPPGAGGQSGTGLTLVVALLLAAGGGFLLNLMPCVFPVLSLKALTFASTSSNQQSHHLHGWAYTAGVVGSFLAVAVLILVARAAGQTAGWGFQLQSPVFVAMLAYLFFVMGLSLSGMVSFGTGLMGIGHGLTTNSGLRGSFFTGVLAAVVASPCTGPMMAPALGFALTQPPVSALLVFVALGLGMALPFLLLSYSPGFARMLPRPGAWMEKLKEFLAFPMYLTAAWLLFVFGRQVGLVALFFLCAGAVAIAMAIWLYNNLPQGTTGRRTTQAAAAGFLAFAAFVAFGSERFNSNLDDWQPYSENLVQNLREQGRPVFVDFTADWCITCKANEKVALSRAGFKAAVSEHNVALVKADWTNQDPAISRVLAYFERSGVPLYLVYPADTSQSPEILPQFLTQGMVIDALKRAADSGAQVAAE